jgi:siderophore synthetase component
MGQFISTNGPQLPYRGLPPHEMPHGLLAVPDWVRQAIAEDKANKPGLYNAEAEERALCDLTLQHYFEAEGYEVLYRSTPAGPEVVAVGDDESIAARRAATEEENRRLLSWVP